MFLENEILNKEYLTTIQKLPPEQDQGNVEYKRSMNSNNNVYKLKPVST